MKKKLSIFIMILSSFSVFSAERIINRHNYAEYTLSNGIELYILEDFSSAKINIELQVRAGISAHSRNNTGFFPLYTRLFKYGEKEEDTLKNLQSECNSDSARYKIAAIPSSFEENLENLLKHAFSPHFTDEAITKEYESMKNEVLTYAETPASFLNAAIDSRVFSSAPWKQDSGIYPELFSGKSTDEIRSILKGISENWYTSENTSLYISGCMKKDDILEISKKLAKNIKPAFASQKAEPVKAGGKNKKFVLTDPNFSGNLTQIVVQFTSLNMTQADIASTAFNFNNSPVKKLLLKQRNLAIREADYINAGSAHKNGSSRIIIQALMEEPVNKKVTLADQAELFLAKTKEGIKNCDEECFQNAKKLLNENFSLICSSSKTFMDYLSQFRAVENFSEESDKALSIADRMLSRSEKIQNQTSDEILEACKNEEPFVFVLLNDKVYQKNKKAFDKEGYLLINGKNASWYTQELYKNLEEDKEDSRLEENVENTEETSLNRDYEYIKENRASIKTIKLSNGIPVTVKTTGTTGNILIMISLKLGKFSYPENPGFEQIITRAFANNIQKEIYNYRINNALENEPEILSETFNDYTAVTVECAKNDAAICLKCISDAILFSDIMPSEADSYVYSVQTQKRLFNASSQNQMTYRALRWLFPKGVIRNVYDTDSDILEKTTYQDILNAYPSLLDSRLYNIVIVGNIDWEYLLEPLKNTFELFTAQKTPLKEAKVEEIDFPDDKSVNCKLKHLFTTDIKAEDAGPMPAVLIPTVNFSDPVQFWLTAPLSEGNSIKEETVYDSLIYRFKEILDEENEKESKTKDEKIFSEIKLLTRTKEIPASSFTFMTVNHTKEMEELYKKARKAFLNRLKGLDSDGTFNEEIQKKEIEKTKSIWIMKALDGTGDNRGTSILIRNGGENPQKYLESYEELLNAKESDFIISAEKYIIEKPKLRLYSSESRQ